MWFALTRDSNDRLCRSAAWRSAWASISTGQPGVRGRLGEDPTKLGDSTLVPFERLAPAVGLVRFSMGYPARTADC
jgi:hypothetical protein